MTKIAVLDDYQGVALQTADWSAVQARAEVTVFRDHLAEPDALVARLLPFDAVCVMRERTPLPRAILERLPNLQLHRLERAAQRVDRPGGGARRAASPSAAPATARRRHGADLGADPCGRPPHPGGGRLPPRRRLAGRRGRRPAGQHARDHGAGQDRPGDRQGRPGVRNGRDRLEPEPDRRDRRRRPAPGWWTRPTLLRESDYLTLHLVLSERSRGIVGAAELAQMKPTAWLVNTSRGPLVDEAALVDALDPARHRGRGAGRVRRRAAARRATSCARCRTSSPRRMSASLRQGLMRYSSRTRWRTCSLGWMGHRSG